MSTITVEKGNVLVNNLPKHLDTSCATLKRYNNNVQFNLQQLQEKMVKNEIVKVNLNNVCTYLYIFKADLQLFRI